MWREEQPQEGPWALSDGEICFLPLLLRLARKFGPVQPFQHCVGACGFWQGANISIFSQKVRERASDRLELSYAASSDPALLRAAGAAFVQKDALSAPLDAGHLLTELPHMAAWALTFTTVGTSVFPHRCCSGNY